MKEDFQWTPRGDTGSEPQSPIDMPHAIWRILFHRGILLKSAIKDHFNPSLKALADPFSLRGMDAGVERLIQALDQKQNLCIYGDYDLDGTSGVALLKQGLEGLGFESVGFYQPQRFKEGYGFHAHAVRELAQKNTHLIVTVDVGITDIEACEVARDLGIDVIITDHHLPKETLPKALAVINPNQSECNSDLSHLCGTGVGFYLILGLIKRLKQQGKMPNDFNTKQLLDCFVIATVTDMVPMIKENRVLMKHGLLELAKTQRPGLRALLEKLEMHQRSLNETDVGFRLAPKLNALSRLEMGLRPLDILLEPDLESARELVDEVIEQNEQRVSLQKKAEKHALGLAQEMNEQGYVFVYDQEYHQGVVGLVATKISGQMNVPSFVGSLRSDGKIVGSARAPANSALSVLYALEVAKDHLDHFGGHAAAAGFELSVENAESFMQTLRVFYASTHQVQEKPRLTFDTQVRLGEINALFMKWFEALGPFGPGFEMPLLKTPRVSVEALRQLKGGHLKLELKGAAPGERATALYFSPPAGVSDHLKLGDEVEVLFEPQWNHWKGQKSLQLLVKDLKRGHEEIDRAPFGRAGLQRQSASSPSRD